MVRIGSRPQVRALHFLPPGLGHHLSVLQPSLEDDLERNDLRLVGARQRLHTLLGLPLNRPLLRSANALDWAVQGEDSGGGSGAGSVARLRDVHVGLVAPGGYERGVGSVARAACFRDTVGILRQTLRNGTGVVLCHICGVVPGGGNVHRLGAKCSLGACWFGSRKRLHR